MKSNSNWRWGSRCLHEFSLRTTTCDALIVPSEYQDLCMLQPILPGQVETSKEATAAPQPQRPHKHRHPSGTPHTRQEISGSQFYQFCIMKYIQQWDKMNTIMVFTSWFLCCFSQNLAVQLYIYIALKHNNNNRRTKWKQWLFLTAIIGPMSGHSHKE